MYQGWYRAAYSIAALYLCSISTTASAFARPHSPTIPNSSLLLQKTAVSISYNPSHKQADWVFYELGPQQLRNCFSRSGDFQADGELPSNVASQLSDYRGSGFDRGHLSPAGDNKWSRAAMKESFLLSNISPQPPRFNQGIWGRLEHLVRAWGQELGGLWVSTGPFLQKGLRKIGNGLSVPNFYYKAIITKNMRQGIAFILPTDANGELSSFTTSIDNLEAQLGINFFADLDAREESELEARVDIRDWDFQADFRYNPCQKQLDEQNLLTLFTLTQ